MGIFSFFSKDSEEDEEELELAAEQAAKLTPHLPESAPTGELFLGMRIDVMTKDGTPQLSGRIIGLDTDTLTLGRLPGELSFKIAPIGAAMNLSGYDKKLIPISLSATVQESSRTTFKLKDLNVVSHAENREAFRLPYSAPVSLYREDDDRYKNAEECQLINISTGGCCIQSEYIHMEDEVLRIRVKLDEYAPLNFMGQIVRCVERSPGKFWYGILFAQLTEQEITALNKTLYNLQMGIKETRIRSSEDDHW